MCTRTAPSLCISDLLRNYCDSFTGEIFDTFFARTLSYGPLPWIRTAYYRHLFQALVQKTLVHRNALYLPENVLGVIYEVSTDLGLHI